MQPQPRIEVEQDEERIIVDYYPTGQPFHRYTAGKVPDPRTTLQLGPAMVQYGASTGWVDLASATAHAGYIIMMTNLALQLDRLIQSPDDLKRRVVIEQAGLQLVAWFEELTNE